MHDFVLLGLQQFRDGDVVAMVDLDNVPSRMGAMLSCRPPSSNWILEGVLPITLKL